MRNKEARLLKIFYCLLRGEHVSTKLVSEAYSVTQRTVIRDIETLKCVLSEGRDVFGNADIVYDRKKKAYYLTLDDLLKEEELLVIVEILIGTRGLEKRNLLNIIDKLKKQVLYHDKQMISSVIKNKILQYQEINHESRDVIARVWNLANMIEKRSMISITYVKMSKEFVKRKIFPMSILFSEYYFYLIAKDMETKINKYFRIDRIVDVVAHREKVENIPKLDEGKLKNEIHYMWPGEKEKIRFEFSGPSVQAVLDKIPTAKIVKKNNDKYIIEAEVLGEGILFYLLSQGRWIKVLEPQGLVDKMKTEIDKMKSLYET